MTKNTGPKEAQTRAAREAQAESTTGATGVQVVADAPKPEAAKAEPVADATPTSDTLEKALLKEVRAKIDSKLTVTPKKAYRRLGVGTRTIAYVTSLKKGGLAIEIPAAGGKYDRVKVAAEKDVAKTVTAIKKAHEKAVKEAAK